MIYPSDKIVNGKRVPGVPSWVPCDCVMWKRVMRTSRITEEFRNKSLRNFTLNGRPDDVKAAYKLVQDYFRNFDFIRKERSNSIALLGAPGTGKTHLLMALSNGLMKSLTSVIYFPWAEAWAELRGDMDEIQGKIEKLQRVDVLFIDDLFKGRKQPTEFQLETMFTIINDRYLNRRPILLSSEWTWNRIIELDEGLGTRLYEMCRDYTQILSKSDKSNYRMRDM